MEIRDSRDKEWFWLDNEYLNGYAKHLGTTASLVYISLCRHANNTTQTCYPSMELIAEELGMQRSSIGRAIKKLSDWNIISITETYDQKTKKRNNNIYTLLSKNNWKSKPNKSHVTINNMDSHVTIKSEPCNNDIKSHVTQSYSNKTNINKTNITIAKDKPLHPNVPEIIKAFEEINPACKRMYGNNTQRQACNDLIETYGFEKVIKAIGFLKNINSNPKAFYKATTPLQLWNNWVNIKNQLVELYKNIPTRI